MASLAYWLCLATRRPLRDICRITWDDVSEDCSTVDIRDQAYHLGERLTERLQRHREDTRGIYNPSSLGIMAAGDRVADSTAIPSGHIICNARGMPVYPRIREMVGELVELAKDQGE